MISKPTTPQLIDAVCAELANEVAPALDGPTRVVLDMAIGVLSAAAVRCATEISWMNEEAAAIEQLGRRLAAEIPDPTDLRTAIAAYDGARTASALLADVQSAYECAGEVLSCAIEAAYRTGRSDHIAAVTELVRERIAHQNVVTGTFEAVGRSST
jgi:hypothetical protein